MKITNKFGLPQPLVNARSQFRPFVKNRRSVTQLISPQQLRKLTEAHWDELEEDVSDGIWMIFGTAVHKILEEFGDDEAEHEVKMKIPVGDWTVTGIIDRIAGATLQDWKTTSVWSYILGGTEDWERQLNLYAFLATSRGYEVDNLEVIALFKDWRKGEYTRAREKGDPYPEKVERISIPLWTEQEQYNYLTDRLTLHQSEILHPCSDEERWLRGEKWAVMKGKNKRATKLHDSAEAAERHAVTLGHPYWVEHRRGEYKRCMDYCPVAQFCEQWKGEQGV